MHNKDIHRGGVVGGYEQVEEVGEDGGSGLIHKILVGEVGVDKVRGEDSGGEQEGGEGVVVGEYKECVGRIITIFLIVNV